jgi:heme-degrading monooxygenase HmoA
MFVIQLDLGVKDGCGAAFEAFYREVFQPALAQQPGFSQTQLLTDHAPQARTHRLAIAFESEALQKKWMATELHDQVSAKLMELISKVCSADQFDLSGMKSG